MSGRKKILLLGDYSNCHAHLAQGLRQLDCDVTVMCPVNYLSDNANVIDTSRRDGKLGGIHLFLKAFYKWHKKMAGYDIVAINDPNFMLLRPERLSPLFRRLKNENDAVFYTAMSTDVNYQRMCAEKHSPLRYCEFFIDGKPSPWFLQDPGRWEKWHSKSLSDYQDYVFNNLDGAVSVLYEYHLGLKYRFVPDMIAYGGIPVVTDEIPLLGPATGGKIRIFLGRDRKRIRMKGTDLLEIAAKRVASKYPEKIELKIAENIPYPLFIEELKKSDIVLDQVYSYTPATTALLAMAMGKTVVSGGEPEFYEFIGEPLNHPIVNASLDIDTLASQIEEIALDRHYLFENAEKSRAFIEKHNKETVVAKRFLDFWTKRLNQATT